MATYTTDNFLAGVIEGFYGPPWTHAERFELFDWMARGGLNTYFYAPKDDLNQRAIWRELYSATEAEALGQLIRACQERNLRFVYALSPGLDIRYSNAAELERLQRRFAQILALGGQNFSLLFDDIPDRMDPADRQRWGSFASAQCQVVNALFRWTRERCPGARFLFCPTPYCGRMAEAQLGGVGYLATVGRELLPEIDVFWTGPEIISREITVAHAAELQTVLRRKPLIWDNLHANDYDGRRFFCGPYCGRPPELRNAVSGLLINPNTEFPLNFVAIRTLAEFVRCPGTWNSRQAYRAAMREWLPYFATSGPPLELEDLILLGDCYYLPHEEGAEAVALFERVCALLARNPANWGNEAATVRRQIARLREFCFRLTELRHRPLFYALNRRVWELREELDLLDRYLAFKSSPGNQKAAYHPDSHLPGTYRGGMVARLQRLLVPQTDGTIAPAPVTLPGAAEPRRQTHITQ
ncbi:MAG: beta-N-acetylglucosaminidase domain-containing protein [Verrucomicrobiota bacterium]